MLVYDRHNVIYAYGPLEGDEAILSLHFFETRPSISIPDPHVDQYQSVQDNEEAAVLNYCDWIFSELRDGDEE